jgi:hypothetical protein
MENFIERNENQPKQFTHKQNELDCKMTINQCGTRIKQNVYILFENVTNVLTMKPPILVI